MVNKINQEQKDKYCLILFVSRVGNFLRTESRRAVAGAGWGRMGSWLMGTDSPLCKTEKVPKRDGGDGCITI